jgi:hypothetical protein
MSNQIGPDNSRPETEGLRLLNLVLTRESKTSILTKGGLNPNTLNRILKRQAIPTPEVRSKIEIATGIKSIAWDEPPRIAVPTPTRTESRPVPVRSPVSDDLDVILSSSDAARQINERVIRILYECMRGELEKDPSSRNVAQMDKWTGQLTRATEQLAKLNDEIGKADEERFVKSARFTRIVDGIVSSVGNCPRCLNKVRELFRKEVESE